MISLSTFIFLCLLHDKIENIMNSYYFALFCTFIHLYLLMYYIHFLFIMTCFWFEYTTQEQEFMLLFITRHPRTRQCILKVLCNTIRWFHYQIKHQYMDVVCTFRLDYSIKYRNICRLKAPAIRFIISLSCSTKIVYSNQFLQYSARQ